MTPWAMIIAFSPRSLRTFHLPFHATQLLFDSMLTSLKFQGSSSISLVFGSLDGMSIRFVLDCSVHVSCSNVVFEAKSSLSLVYVHFS